MYHLLFTQWYMVCASVRQLEKTITREPGYPGSYEKILSITRVFEIRVFWTH